LVIPRRYGDHDLPKLLPAHITVGASSFMNSPYMIYKTLLYI
jgi:hypothetical protein